MSTEKKKGILRPFFMVLSVILGLICITYGLHVKAQNYGTAFFVIWILLGLIGFGLCVAIYFRLWSKLPKWIKIPFCAILIIGVGIFVWVEALIYSQVKVGIRPTLFALSTIIFVVVLIVLVISNIVSGRREGEKL